MSQLLQQKNQRLIVKLGSAIVLMFGFGFALVPLYDVFCEVTGLNGRNVVRAQEQSLAIDTSRTIRLQLMTSVAPDMPWLFEPMVNYVDVHPGENKVVKFKAHNLSERLTVGQAVPSVSPGLAASYLNKTECFCFKQQPLNGGEQTKMGLVFFISPDIPKNIKTLTLSYTLFNVSEIQKDSELAGI
jgi:cytochrome c oxidase assembly protein subunit 11